jgi:AraC family transcriptional regulator, glycine betaine-responsive activator
MAAKLATRLRVVPPPGPERIGFLLIPGFSMLDFASATDVLGGANETLGRTAYQWQAISISGKQVEASNGIPIWVDVELGEVSRLDRLFICAEVEVKRGDNQAVHQWLRALERDECRLGAIGAGTYVLAKAELVRGRNCTIHWQLAPWLLEQFPNINLSKHVFESDRGLLTCCGGTAVVDMFVRMIASVHGREIADELSMELLVDRVRSQHDEQQSAPLAQLGSRPRKLQSAIRHMEATVETPLSPEWIASQVGVTTRHLQRLFRLHTGASPARFYMDLRLRRARLLLQQTRMPVLEVAVAVGFTSHSHFSKRYRERYGLTPVQQRAA